MDPHFPQLEGSPVPMMGGQDGQGHIPGVGSSTGAGNSNHQHSHQQQPPQYNANNNNGGQQPGYGQSTQPHQNQPSSVHYFMGPTFNFVFQRQGTFDVNLNIPAMAENGAAADARYQQQQQQPQHSFGSQAYPSQLQPQHYQPVPAFYTPNPTATTAVIGSGIRLTATSPPANGNGSSSASYSIGEEA